MNAPLDNDLFNSVKCGDKDAFTTLYNRFWPLLFSHAYRMLRDEDDATDVIQEIFVTIWTKAEEINIAGNLSGYLYGATRNKVLDKINKNKNRDKYINSLTSFIERGELSTDEHINTRELASIIEKEIANLPEKMRITFELSRKKHLSYKEIAKITQTSEGTVKKQIYNALKILKPKFYTIAIGITSLFFK